MTGWLLVFWMWVDSRPVSITYRFTNETACNLARVGVRFPTPPPAGWTPGVAVVMCVPEGTVTTARAWDFYLPPVPDPLFVP